MTARPGRSSRVLAAAVLSLVAAMPAVADHDHEGQIRAYVEIWNNADTAALEEVVSEDFVRHGNYGSARSREQLGDLIRGFHGFYRDLRIDLLDSFAGAEKGAMRYRFHGGYGKTSFEMAATNFSLVRFSDGKIAEEWVAGNTTDFWTSMGYRILPPGTRMVPPPVIDPPGAHAPPPPDLREEELIEYAARGSSHPPQKAGQVVVTAAVDCRLSLDGESIGGLEAGKSVLLHVAPGEHSVAASSRGGTVLFSDSIRVRRDKIARVDIAPSDRTIVDRQHGIAEDLDTGLMWQVADNGSDITQKAAAVYCDEASEGGFSDWRLPTIYELESLYAPENASRKRFHTIDAITLSGCCPWTVSPHGDFYWTFVFYNGLRYIKYESIGKFSRALCVRHAG